MEARAGWEVSGLLDACAVFLVLTVALLFMVLAMCADYYRRKP